MAGVALSVFRGGASVIGARCPRDQYVTSTLGCVFEGDAVKRVLSGGKLAANGLKIFP
jgi:hypothetical protein